MPGAFLDEGLEAESFGGGGEVGLVVGPEVAAGEEERGLVFLLI